MKNAAFGKTKKENKTKLCIISSHDKIAPTKPTQDVPPSYSMIVDGLEVLHKVGKVNTYFSPPSQDPNKRNFFKINEHKTMWGKRKGYNSARNFETRKQVEDGSSLEDLKKLNFWWQNPRINLICTHGILKGP